MFKGSYVALITPYDTAGAVDFGTLRGLVQWHIEAGTDGLVLCGSTGEGSLLTFEEKRAVFQAAAEVGKNKLTLIGATGTNLTSESVALTRAAKGAGLDGCLVIFPYYVKPSFEGCMRHFAEISKEGLPIITYHHPGRTGVSLSLEQLLKIYAIEEVVGVKESSGDFLLAQGLAEEQVPFFSGDDLLAFAHLSVGASGTISVIGNVLPEEWNLFVHLALEKKWEEARAEFNRLYNVSEALSLETNPQCIKYATSLLGKCLPALRLPLLEPTEENKIKVKASLQTAVLALQ